MKKNANKILELADLQQAIIFTCNSLNRPIRKTHLIQMITDLFEYNTPKQVDFALIDLIEQGKLQQKDYFIITPEAAFAWNGTVTAADGGIIRFLLSSTLKEEAKHDLFFNVYAQEPLTPHIFFKYVGMKYPALLQRKDTALAYMKQMENTFYYGLNNDFYAEMNDYPAEGRWFGSFLNDPDRRIIIKDMDMHRNHVNIQIMLIAGKRRSYRKANADFDEFKENISRYFNSNMNLHIRKSITTIPIGNKRKRKKGW